MTWGTGARTGTQGGGGIRSVLVLWVRLSFYTEGEAKTYRGGMTGEEREERRREERGQC